MPLIKETAPARRAKCARQLCWLEIDSIRPNPYQPRQSFSDAQLQELADSIRQVGLLSPISVRRMGVKDYELIAGERRLRACKLLGMTHIDAIVMPAFEQESALIALIENLQREDLHFLDEAEALQGLIRDHAMTQEELARRLGRSASSVANKLRILKLSQPLRERIREGGLSERHARALLRLPDEGRRQRVLEEALARHLSVKQLEALVEQVIACPGILAPPRKKPRALFRDHRIFINSVLDTVRMLKSSGINVTSRVEEKEDCVEVVVILPRIGGREVARGS